MNDVADMIEQAKALVLLLQFGQQVTHAHSLQESQTEASRGSLADADDECDAKRGKKEIREPGSQRGPDKLASPEGQGHLSEHIIAEANKNAAGHADVDVAAAGGHAERQGYQNDDQSPPG